MRSYSSSVSPDASWVAGYFCSGNAGGTRSTALFYALGPGNRLGWHTNTSEEVQFVLGGRGELHLDGAVKAIGRGDFFLVGEDEHHDIRNTGEEDLRVLAFFPEPEVEHRWTDEVWQPGDRRVTGGGGS